MKWIVWCMAALSVTAALGIAQNSADFPKHTAGTYIVYMGDKKIQTDSYEVTAVDKAVDIIKASDAEGEQKIEIGMNSKSGLVTAYQKSLNGASELKAVVEKDYIWFYEREAKVGALTIDPYLMFFDPTAYAAYTLLVRSYNTAKGGSQTFPVIVPALQDYCEIEMERHGSETFTSAGKTISAAHYRMTLGKRETVNLWVDADRVIAITLSVKGITAVDASVPDILKDVKRVTTKSL